MTLVDPHLWGADGVPVRAGSGRPLPPPVAPGVFIGQSEIDELPASGASFDNMMAAADSYSSNSVDYGNQDSNAGGLCYASALAWAKTGGAAYRNKVRDAIDNIVGSPYPTGGSTGTVLAWARVVPFFVYAGDVINLASYAPSLDAQWRSHLAGMLQYPNVGNGGESLQNMAERRPNNIGTSARNCCLSIGAYLNDDELVDLMARLHFSWVQGGARHYPLDATETGETGWTWNADVSWHCNPAVPSTYLGVNPVGCARNGHNLDGIFPDDYRRSGPYDPESFPGSSTNDYAWDVVQGITCTTELLRRRGYPAHEWGNRALLRSLQRLRYFYENYSGQGWEWAPAGGGNGDDRTTPYVVNFLYGTSFEEPALSGVGRGLAWTDWTHDGRTLV